MELSLEMQCLAPSLYMSSEKGVRFRGASLQDRPTRPIVGIVFSASGRRQILARTPCHYSALTFQVKCFFESLTGQWS